jgi:hypothetical protein
MKIIDKTVIKEVFNSKKLLIKALKLKNNRKILKNKNLLKTHLKDQMKIIKKIQNKKVKRTIKILSKLRLL